MPDNKHTPGPWSRNIKPARKYTVIFAGRNTHVAKVIGDGLSDEEVEANCDLITAAPELAGALLDVYKFLSDSPIAELEAVEAALEENAPISKIRAALTKAGLL